ncbi:MAG: tetratricopeptide repeat protein [Acidobacteriota bacterium]
MLPRPRLVLAPMLAAGLVWGLALCSCTAGNDEGTTARRDPKPPVVDLSRVDPQVHEVVSEALDAVDTAIEYEAPAAERGEAFGMLAELCHAHELPACALEAYGAAAALQGEDLRWPYLEGHLLLALDRPDEARAAFGRASALDPEAVAPRRAMADAALAAGSLELAEQGYRAVLEVAPSDASALWALGRLELDRAAEVGTGERPGEQDGLLESAAAHLAAAHAAAPAADAIEHALARLARLRGQHDAAREHALRAGSTAPAVSDVHLERLARRRTGVHNLAARAQDEVLAGRLSDAVATYRVLLTRAPDDLRARVNLASILVRLGQLDTARRELEEVLERAPDDIAALYNLGTLELLAGRAEQAADVLDRVLARADEHGEAALNRSIAAWQLDDLETAAETIARAVSSRPHDELPWRWWAVIELRSGRAPKALHRLDDGLERVGTADERAVLEADRIRLLATVESVGVHDAAAALIRAEAIEDAVAALPATLAWDAWRSLAMAAAAAGDLRAVAWQQRAVGSASRSGAVGALDQLRDELTLYREGGSQRLRWWRPLGEVVGDPILPGQVGGGA